MAREIAEEEEEAVRAEMNERLPFPIHLIEELDEISRSIDALRNEIHSARLQGVI
jgi:hypothetical protein